MSNNIGFEVATKAEEQQVVDAFRAAFCRKIKHKERLTQSSRRLQGGWRFDQPGEVDGVGPVLGRGTYAGHEVILRSSAEGQYRIFMLNSDGDPIRLHRTGSPMGAVLTDGLAELVSLLEVTAEVKSKEIDSVQ